MISETKRNLYLRFSNLLASWKNIRLLNKLRLSLIFLDSGNNYSIGLSVNLKSLKEKEEVGN